MEIDIKKSTPKENEYKLGILYKDNDGNIFYFVRDGEYVNVNYLTMEGHLVENVTGIGLYYQSVQEIVKRAYLEMPAIPKTPIPAKKLTIEF